ncbi:E3 ubiquitin-protein ligase [Rhynchospora pubera]|uniref:E3 ubiquitin-protein ligase n=1 Tax=Rhynchospora pubera TaxID=906938 RepID=A0AAV8HHC1_9POAL|nr:E3 ubiquitin-protein ligase [Rhynchospora pubera]
MAPAHADDSAVSLSDDERRALRGSKFAPLPPPPSSRSHPRLAHPGGPVKTNKAAALAKFLERKLQQPDGLKSINPDLLELAVKNAKETVKASSRPSTSAKKVHHVSSFEDSSEDSGSDQEEPAEINDKKRKRKNLKVLLHCSTLLLSKNLDCIGNYIKSLSIIGSHKLIFQVSRDIEEPGNETKKKDNKKKKKKKEKKKKKDGKKGKKSKS